MKKIIFIISIFLVIVSCENKKVSINTITQEEFAKLSSLDIQLLDVRTPDEYKRGVIEGATAINYFDSDFVSQVQPKFDKNKPIYLYCASGGRSSKASSLLVLDGFVEVYNLKGGYNAWKENNK